MQELKLFLKSIKLVEENTEVNLCDLGLGKVLLDMITEAQVTRKIDKVDFITHRKQSNLKSSRRKGYHQDNKYQSMELDKVFASHITYKALESRIYEELL